MKRSRNYYPGFLLLLFFVSSGNPSLFAQNKKYSAEIEQKIKAVEQSLASWVQIDGSPKWTLKERMNLQKPNLSFKGCTKCSRWIFL